MVRGASLHRRRVGSETTSTRGPTHRYPLYALSSLYALHLHDVQTTPLMAGLAVGAAAWTARAAYEAFHGWKAAGPRMRQFYKGGFLPEMTKREAAQILGIRESAAEQKVREAHRRIMIANHPDAGGSSYIATKINEAKDMLLKKKSGGGSVF